MVLKDLRCEVVEWINVTERERERERERPGMGCLENYNKPSLPIKGGRFLDQPKAYYILQMQSAPRKKLSRYI